MKSHIIKASVKKGDNSYPVVVTIPADNEEEAKQKLFFQQKGRDENAKIKFR